MCDPQPGPRCASGVRKRRDSARAEAETVASEMGSLIASGTHDQTTVDALQKRKWAASRRIQETDQEWDETPDGRAELAAAANTLLKNARETDDPNKVRALKSEARSFHDRLRAGVSRHTAKKEALACVRDDDPTGANLTLRLGPGTAWLKNSGLRAQATNRIDIETGPGFAVAVTDRDSSKEEDASGEQYYTERVEFAVEQPITRIGKDGKGGLTVGGHPMSGENPVTVHTDADGVVVSAATSDARWTPASRHVEARGLADRARGLAGVDEGTEIEWDTPVVVNGPDGRPAILRTTGRLESSVSLRDRNSYQPEP